MSNETQNFCGTCGFPLEKNAQFCGECGTALYRSHEQKTFPDKPKNKPDRKTKTQVFSSTGDGSKNKATATLLALFLGAFGAHKFYMGSWGWGIIYLLTCWLLVPYLFSLVETVKYILMTDEEFMVKAERFEDKGPFGFFW